ncbi:MAG: RAMP superfamily CRISPR-associated protein [Zestosphaera sp.]
MRVFDLIFNVDEVRVGTRSYGNELEMLKYGDLFIIPYSTWKGAFRRTSEVVQSLTRKEKSLDSVVEKVRNVLRDLDVSKEFDEKMIFDFTNKIEDELKKVGFAEEAEGVGPIIRDKVVFDRSSREELEEAIVPIVISYLDPLNRLYGSPYFAGALVFSDSVMSNKEVKSGLVSKVSINRATRKSEEQALFVEEVIYPRRVRVRVNMRRVPNSAIELWRSTLRFSIDVGVPIGAGKSKRSWAVLNLKDSLVTEVKLTEQETLKLQSFLA